MAGVAALPCDKAGIVGRVSRRVPSFHQCRWAEYYYWLEKPDPRRRQALGHGTLRDGAPAPTGILMWQGKVCDMLRGFLLYPYSLFPLFPNKGLPPQPFDEVNDQTKVLLLVVHAESSELYSPACIKKKKRKKVSRDRLQLGTSCFCTPDCVLARLSHSPTASPA